MVAITVPLFGEGGERVVCRNRKTKAPWSVSLWKALSGTDLCAAGPSPGAHFLTSTLLFSHLLVHGSPAVCGLCCRAP